MPSPVGSRGSALQGGLVPRATDIGVMMQQGKRVLEMSCGLHALLATVRCDRRAYCFVAGNLQIPLKRNLAELTTSSQRRLNLSAPREGQVIIINVYLYLFIVVWIFFIILMRVLFRNANTYSFIADGGTSKRQRN